MSERTIDLWAPIAREVTVRWAPVPTDHSTPAVGRETAMHPGADGWWHASLPTTSEIDYAFVLDGAEPALPDPRSAWQPVGVHGPSRTVDPSSFTWTDQLWRGPRDGAGALGSVIYELHVGTFTKAGTLDAAIDRLDHLVDLGVDVVELLPVAAFPVDRGWGYDGVALYGVQDSIGGPHALARFVDACHARGIGVCLDIVQNHLGPSGNYLSRFGPYFTSRHTTPWGWAINLDDDGSHQVRAFLREELLRWFRDFHIDAIRLDAVHELVDTSRVHYLAEASDAVAALSADLGRPLDLIAESDLNDVVMVTPTLVGGRGMSAQWDDDIHHSLHVTLTGEDQGYYRDFAGDCPALPDGGPLAVLATVLTRGFLHDGTFSSFRGREWGVPIDRFGLDARRLLGYLQTHDQVGNRAAGERISHLVSTARQACGAALYLLAPTTPMIFMGEEWGASTPWQFFTSYDDPQLAESVRAGRRAEFGSHGWSEDQIPDPQDPATRDRSVLNWREATQGEHARLRRWYTELIALRHDWLGSARTSFADVSVAFDDQARWLTMTHRPSGRVPYAVAVNLGDTQSVPLPGTGDLALAYEPNTSELRGTQIALPADSAAVVRLD